MISKIAIFRALHLGDMLCIIPTIRAIRHAWPHAEIFLIGLPWQKEFRERFSHYFDHFIEFPGWPGLPEQKADPEKILAFLHHIRTFKFDVVFQMQGNGELTNSLCMLWGARTVCGLRKRCGYAPEEHLFPVSEDSDHEVTRFFKLLECFKLEVQGMHLEFPLTTQEEECALTMIEKSGLLPKRYVCIHPGARDPRRRWPIENFALIANELTSNGIPVVLTGSAEEAALLTQLERNIHSRVLNVVNAFGHVSVGMLGGLIRNAKLLVSNDTGVSHLAAALQTPSVIIFSPHSAFERWRPLSDRNIAIPFERATEPEYVLAKVVEALSSYYLVSD